MLRFGPALLGCVLVTAPALAQPATPPAPQPTPDFAKVEIKTTKVAGNVYLLEYQGGNIAVGNIAVSAGPDGLLIVDDQFWWLADKIKAALRAIDQGDLQYVLNTHWHGDHTGGNPVFGLEALIVAHENVRKRLSTEQTVRSPMGTQKVRPMVAAGLPVITFDAGLTIHFNGEAIRMIHAEPGHTDGDSIIYFPQSNVLHVGDDFITGGFPFVDLASGGRVQGIARTVARVLEDFPADVKIIPGHGALAGRADLELYQRMIKETMQTVKAGIESGKSLEEIQRAGLSAEWKDWAGPPDTAGLVREFWIDTVYQSLRQERQP
jgi:glyoxylase-like metal-dependent hydrolase (beta-lactamase superfamily II)